MQENNPGSFLGTKLIYGQARSSNILPIYFDFLGHIVGVFLHNTKSIKPQVAYAKLMSRQHSILDRQREEYDSDFSACSV